jgi:GH15 family glucan-1,4-alpha-glucosidase
VEFGRADFRAGEGPARKEAFTAIQGRMSRCQPIENHGVIGDLQTVALVGMDGAIDFMCFPRFDSPTMFAALLDQERGGLFKLAPLINGATLKQIYLPDSNVLLTRFLALDGMAEVSDFMPVCRK